MRPWEMVRAMFVNESGAKALAAPGNPWGIKRIAHSVLTEELVDDDGHPTKQALDRVLGFFEERLQQTA